MKKIKVLVVDDSSLIRKIFEKIFSANPDIELVGLAPDAYVAREMLVEKKPDIMILDVEMPKMDGITFLSKVMSHFPTKTIICSSLGREGSDVYFKSLEAGAIEVIEKPTIESPEAMEKVSKFFIDKVRQIAGTNVSLGLRTKPVQKATVVPATFPMTQKVLAIASSTGGTEALKVLLAGMPANIPGTVIVQHMPPVFTKNFSTGLNQMFPFEVKEAQDGDIVQQGRVLIAPGNFHMELRKAGSQVRVHLHQEPLLHSVRPAADFLLKSVAKYLGSQAIGVILTGMGRDGAEGLLSMKKAGSYTLAQDEASCVVFGMPKVAIELGAVDKVLSLEKISAEVLQKMVQKSVAA